MQILKIQEFNVVFFVFVFVQSVFEAYTYVFHHVVLPVGQFLVSFEIF